MDQTELSENIDKLKHLAKNAHILCGRRIGDATQRIPDPDACTRLTFDCLFAFAYDDEVDDPRAITVRNAVGNVLSACEKCMRRYYMGRKAFEDRLKGTCPEDAIEDFLATIDNWDFRRVDKLIEAAARKLAAIPPESSALPIGKILQVSELLAVFEIFCNPQLLERTSIKSNFEAIFRVSRAPRLLRVQAYVPAVVVFGFRFPSNGGVASWVRGFWNRVERGPSDDEFDWTVRRHLEQQVERASLEPDPSYMARFWNLVKMITAKLSTDQLKVIIIDYEFPLSNLIWEGLRRDSFGYQDITAIIDTLVSTTPASFWQSMSEHLPAHLAERILNAPATDTLLASLDSGMTIQEIGDPRQLLKWTLPFLASQDPRKRAAVCQTITFHLLDRLQFKRVPQTTQLVARELGLQAIVNTLKPFTLASNDGDAGSTSVLISDALACVVRFDSLIRRNLSEKDNPKIASIALDSLITTFTVECNLVRQRYFHLVALDRDAHAYVSAKSLWINIKDRLDITNIDSVVQILTGLKHLFGVQMFNVFRNSALSVTKTELDQQISTLFNTYRQLLAQLLVARNAEIRYYFTNPDAANAITAALFNADDQISESALDLVKAAFDGEGRLEAIANLLTRCQPRDNFLRAFTALLNTNESQVTLSASVRTLHFGTAVLAGLEDLRSEDLITDPEGLSKVLTPLWSAIWKSLRIALLRMDAWTHKTGQQLVTPIDFARDIVQFARHLLDSLDLFETFIGQRVPDRPDLPTLPVLLGSANQSMFALTKWLRIKDPVLNSSVTNLIASLLATLDLKLITPDRVALDVISDVVSGDQNTQLDEESLSTLQSSLKAFGRDVQTKTVPTVSEVAAQRAVIRTTSEAIADHSKSATAYRHLQQNGLPAPPRTAVGQKSQAASKPSVPPGRAPKVAQGVAEFKRKRAEAVEAKRLRDAQEAAKFRPTNSLISDTLTAGANEFGHQIGDDAIDHSKVDAPLDDSEADLFSDSEDDGGLFESNEQKAPGSTKSIVKTRHAAPLRAPPKQIPVVKVKQARTAKDLRARISPNLTTLHAQILQWDIFYNGRYPPGTDERDYRAVSKEFRSPQDYRATFEPLLLMECWQGFLSGKEEFSGKAWDLKVVSRATTGACFELSTSASVKDVKDASIREADVLVLSMSTRPLHEAEAPHCLARVIRTEAPKGGNQEIKMKIALSGPMVSHLTPGTPVHAAKLNTLVTLEREYAALLGLQYYDLCDEIARAKPSPIIKQSDGALKEQIERYGINPAQAQAVLSAWKNDGFTLIQGPPGTGKTKTIVAMAGGMISDSQKVGTTINKTVGQSFGSSVANKRLLICAPSNAAVDELIMRLRAGLILRNGRRVTPKVLRLGHSESAIPAVRDLTWEHQIDARMQKSIAGSKDQTTDIQKQLENIRNKTRSIEKLQEQLREARQKGDLTASNHLDEHIRMARNEKSRMGTLLDTMRDKKNSSTRDLDVKKKQFQLEILKEAQIVCATLSGTGNERLSAMTSIEFDTIIIDEAAQAIELSALIPLKYGCTKCILVGDPKQLPPTVFSMEAKDLQYEQSLFVRMQDNYPEDVHLLNTQYRMHPAISRFPSVTFYDNKLQDGLDMAGQRVQPWHQSALFSPYRFFDIHGSHQKGRRGASLINQAEAEIAYQLYNRLIKDWPEVDLKGKIGIITPYKAQLELLRDTFAHKIGDEKMDSIDFNTIDAFQGRECEIIIYSCVRASGRGIGFLADIRRMNVALTRAKSSLWILGNYDSLRQGKFWKDLLDDAKQRDCYTDGDMMKLLNQTQRGHGPQPVNIPIKRVESLPRSQSSRDSAWPPQPAANNCRRCNRAPHSTVNCEAEVCQSCGELGHSAICSNPNPQGAARVGRMEPQFLRGRDQQTARLQARARAVEVPQWSAKPSTGDRRKLGDTDIVMGGMEEEPLPKRREAVASSGSAGKASPSKAVERPTVVPAVKNEAPRPRPKKKPVQFMRKVQHNFK